MFSPVVHVGLALLLDQLLGDPRWLPHPVRLIGALQTYLETLTRRLIPHAKAAGIVTVLITLTVTGGATYVLLLGAGKVHPIAYDAVAIILLYTSFAARDLARHAFAVYQALQKDDIALARKRVAMIVGRDTADLDEAGVARAGVESVAESLVDGVTAPIFYALLGGPVGALLYKAINTGDSMFGYKNERYIEFGWGAARLDDLVNFLPARLTALFVPLAAFFLGLKSRDSLRILRRDCRAHISPNAGFPEAAVAGALGVQLGGDSSYFGKTISKQTIGDAKQKIVAGHLRSAVSLMLLSSFLFFAVGAFLAHFL